MSVTPDAPVIPLTPPPSLANDWSSTTANTGYNPSSDSSSEYEACEEFALLDEHFMPTQAWDESPLPEDIEISLDEFNEFNPHPYLDFPRAPYDINTLIHTGKWFPNDPSVAGTHATSFLSGQ